MKGFYSKLTSHRLQRNSDSLLYIMHSLIDTIKTLPPHTAEAVSRALNIDGPEKHTRLWNSIFRNEHDIDGREKGRDTWTPLCPSYRDKLNPALLGADLHKIWNDVSWRPLPEAYLFLVVADHALENRHNLRSLLSSLQDHTFDPYTREIVFKETKITLYIGDVLCTEPLIESEKLAKLFEERPPYAFSACIFWKDSKFEYYPIREGDIVSIGGQCPSTKNASQICALTLPINPLIPQQQRFQQVFKTQLCKPVKVISRPGYVYNGDNCLGWEWD